MPGKAIKIGPFNDGLNNVSAGGEARDTEVVSLVNFEVGLDSSLTSRPPMRRVSNDPLMGGRQNKIHGIFRVSSTVWYMIMSRTVTGGTWTLATYILNVNGVPTYNRTIKGGLALENLPTGYVQIDGTAYFSVGLTSTIKGFKSVITETTLVTTDITAMPKGDSMIAFKSRLWISNGASSRLTFSTIDTGGAKPDVWAAADFLDIAPGEGGFITALLAMNSFILIFKNDGTWRFSYPSKPASGQVDKVSGTTGTVSQTTVAEFENYVYVYDQGIVYELVNNTFTQLNRFVRFEEDPLGGDRTAPGVDLSIVNRRILVRYSTAVYAYNIDSRTWSQWRFADGTPGKFYELPASSDVAVASLYIAASAGTVDNTGAQSTSRCFSITDQASAAPVETFTCFMRTKSYDYQLASAYKRMFWWGIDMKTRLPMKATAIPVATEMLPTWGQLQSYTHLELEQGTWGNPLSFLNRVLSIFDGGDPSNDQTENGRIFGKFTKSLRFRQIIFEVEMTCLGSTDSIAKVYSLTTYISPKEKVTAKFN